MLTILHYKCERRCQTRYCGQWILGRTVSENIVTLYRKRTLVTQIMQIELLVAHFKVI